MLDRCPAGLYCFAARVDGHTVGGGHFDAPPSPERLHRITAAVGPLLEGPTGLGPRLTDLLWEQLPLPGFLCRLAELMRDFIGCDAVMLGHDTTGGSRVDWGSTWGIEPELAPAVSGLLKSSRRINSKSCALNPKQLRKLKVKDRWGPSCGLLLTLAPETVQDSSLGFVALLWQRKSSFDPQDRVRAEAVRPEVLLAVRTAALLQAHQEKQQQLADSQRQVESSFSNIGTALASALNLEELLRLVLEMSVKLARMDGGTIRLIEGQQPTMHFTTLPSNNGRAHATSLFFPVCRHDRIKASLNLVSHQRRELGIEEIKLLEAFSAQAAMAIENAQIFEWEQERAREATALYQAARTIEEGQELDEILEQSAEVLARLSEVDRCLILLKDSHRSFFTVAAAIGLSADQEQFFSAFRLHLSQLAPEVRERLMEGKPLSLDAAPSDHSGLHRLCSLLPTSSCLIVPLRSKERLLGIIHLDSSRGAHHFPPSTVRRVLTLSLQVANAIHRASLINQLQDNLGPLKALYQVSTAITGTLSLTKVIRLIVDQAVELLEHSACALLVLDETGDSFRLETSVGVPDELLGPTQQARLARTAVERKRAYSHYADRPDTAPDVREILSRNGFGGLLSVPLIARKKMVGVLNCFVAPDIRFRQQEIRLLRGFANQAAIAVENARLHGMIRFKMGELGTLFEVSKAVTSTLNLDRVLAEIVHHVRDILRADACGLMLLEGQNLLLKASEGIDLERYAKPIPVGKGVAGLAAKTGQTMVLYDRDQDRARFPEALRQEGLKTILSVPIKARGRTIGLVNVYYRDFTSHTPAQVNLLNALGSQAAAAIENARLYADKERVTELLRKALIPSDRLEFPGVTVGHRFIPSMDLSGDYYDLIPLGPKKCAMVIADVSGKGPDAAIQTVRAKHVIKSYALAGYPPAEILRLLNEQVGVDGARQVTVFYAEADLETRTLRFASAGHELPIFWTDLAEPELLRADGILVGAVPEAEYSEEVRALPEGAWMLLYTDGITEARSPSGEFFGLQRVLEVVRDHTGNSAQRLVNRIYTRVRKFTREKITDDFSLMVIRF